MKHIGLLILFLASVSNGIVAKETDAVVFGHVTSKEEHLPFVSIFLEGTNHGTSTDETGHYMLTNLPTGRHVIVARFIGYVTKKDTIEIISGQSLEHNFDLEEEQIRTKDVVVTGTRTQKKITDSPIMVNVLDSESMDAVQACNIMEGLRFQPGLRVETDCQTCNYTQLRMNGLGGSYSQILVNGRPIFSPLIGLYGMEQIPANMVEKIEVVRGGGSALYGSSAIGGTVNIITKIPNKSSYDISVNTQSLDGNARDNILSGNISSINKKRDAGIAVFINRRDRDAYDYNGDNYSEIPELEMNSFGANLFYMPDYNQKIELNFSSLYEYRYGGEMTTKQAYQAQQSEERVHNILMGGVDYQINFNNNNSSLITYLAGQVTDRKHYTGIIPDTPEEIEKHLANPPYGNTDNTTFQVGGQINHRLTGLSLGDHIISLGAEYVYDDVMDTISAYNYKIDQITKNVGAFTQYDWEMNESFTFLGGLRMDKHNFVDNPIISPRLSVLYKLFDMTQFRLTWGTGFRAPQAFDTDMHIAFAGGGVSRITLGDNLKEERSQSLSGSINFDKADSKYIVGFTLEGFYTKLNDSFYLQPIGEDKFGELFEKRNGPAATVQGATLELRANYNMKAQLEAGITLQKSEYDNPVEYIRELEPHKKFMRTPEQYGYMTLMYTPSKVFNASISAVYTGSMLLEHYAGAPEQTVDEYVESDSFLELGLKAGYTIVVESMDTGFEIFAGVKNLTNAYQNDFDSGKNRDSNYIYGPGMPRTVYFGIKLKSFD
jgi:outer membrane receptor for ferrienterochelin and colicins